MTTRAWRKPQPADKLRKCRARNRYEKKPFYVEWNGNEECWSMAGRPWILVAVDEIMEPK